MQCRYFTTGNGIYGEVASRCESVPTKSQWYSSLDVLTFCVLVLQNGFTVTGESACASPENFNAEIVKQIARQNAVNKVLPLMGYELKQRLSDK